MVMASSQQDSSAGQPNRTSYRRAAIDLFKVICVTGGSVVAVIFASLVISIIQFQARLAEARTQNSNITFESIQLIADYQSYVSNLYTTMRKRSEELGPLRADYLDRMSATTQLIISLCNALDAARYAECSTRITALINANNSQLDTVVAEFKPAKPDGNIENFIRVSTDSLKTIVSSGQLIELEKKYNTLRKLIQSECDSLTVYVSDNMSSNSLLAISPELRSTITLQCRLGGLQMAADTGRSAPGQSGDGGTVRQPEQTRPETQGVNRLLLSELVFYYKFYGGLASIMGKWVQPLILAPPEFVTIILVLSTGILGSFLSHTYMMFAHRSGVLYPSFTSILLRATLGAMCALVLFILMRTGFVAVTESRNGQAAAAMSPFVIAFVSVAAGLLAEPTMERIRSVGLTAINGQQKMEPSAGSKGKGEPKHQDADHTPPALPADQTSDSARTP
jgi:hypothetical protein